MVNMIRRFGEHDLPLWRQP